MNGRIISVFMVSLILLLASMPVSSVSGAPLLVDTFTPQPTETIAPTLTPFIPPLCGATSIIPTSPPLYTPTDVLPTVTGTVTVFPTVTSTPVVTATPYGEGGGCDVITVGSPVVSTIELGVNGSTVSVVGSCYAVIATGFCDYTITFQRNSNFWNGNSGVVVSVPVYDLIPSSSVIMYYHETDFYQWDGGTLDDVVRLGFSDSSGCPVGFDIGLGGDGSCTVRTDQAVPAVMTRCGGQGVLNVDQSCHITFDFVFGSESCFSIPVPTATPSCTISGEVEPSEMIAYFNPPSYSLLGCYAIFQPINLPLPSLSWSPFELPASVGFPGWQICIQLLSFAAVFAGVDWALILGGFVTLFSVGGIYTVLRDQ